MKIQMTSTQNGSVDGIRVKSYVAGTEHDLNDSAGARSLAKAFVDAGMAVEIIEGTVESWPDDSDPGIQIDAQGLKPVEEKPAEAAPDSNPKRPYVRKQKNSKE